VNQNRILWIALAGSPAAVLVVMLTLVTPGQAAPAQPAGHSGAPAPVEAPVALELPPLALETSPHATADAGLFPNCRFGVAVEPDQVTQFDIVSELGAGWYLDFNRYMDPPGPAEAEFAQMIRIYQGEKRRGGSNNCGPDYDYKIGPPLTDNPHGLGTYININPGALWIVGNEPERIGQGDICPQQYAEAYHEVYHFIKDRDPTARVAIAGLVEVTPGRLQYLDIVWDTYLEEFGTTMPVDVWTTHLYILSEKNQGDANIALGTDPNLAIGFNPKCTLPNRFCHAEHDDMNLFMEQVETMRVWMKEHDQQKKPLLITEYGILKPYHFYGTCPPETTSCAPGCFCDEYGETFHPNRVASYITKTFDYLLTATDPELGYPADEYRLVQQWLWYHLAQPVDPPAIGHAGNLANPDSLTELTIPGQRWQEYAAAITPTVNLLPVHVPTFYSEEGLTMPIGEATFTGLGGCARRTTVVTTTWGGLTPETHYFWVKVDSPETVTETKETDNVGSGMVVGNPRLLFLPLVLHTR
jgi:hypothetical protein